MTNTHGTVIWTELMTRDVDAAKRYYEKICSWTFKSMPMGPGNPDYVLGMKGETPIVGIMDLNASPDDDATEPFWMSYFAVDDVDAAVDATVASGGTLKREPFEIPDTGRIAIVIDPTGAELGLMTPVEMPDS